MKRIVQNLKTRMTRTDRVIIARNINGVNDFWHNIYKIQH